MYSQVQNIQWLLNLMSQLLYSKILYSISFKEHLISLHFPSEEPDFVIS